MGGGNGHVRLRSSNQLELFDLIIGDVEFSVFRTNRKTIGITVESDGSPILRVPKVASEDEIQRLVSRRIEWVKRKIQYAQNNSLSTFTPSFKLGTQLPYLGKFHTIHEGSNSTFGLFQGRFVVPSNETEKIETLAMKWYRETAEKYLVKRLRTLQEKYEEKPSSIRVLDLKSRWASCSQDKTINLNWKLVLLPVRLIDYVLHHEMCHLKIHNHSNRYWKHLQNKCPNWDVLSSELEEKAIMYYISSQNNDMPNHSLENDTAS